jgi:ribose/xylose/arabinose/galactoside ABC-type transport system permease subunit
MASAGFLVAGVPIPLAILLGTGVGGAAGLLNGILINYASIPPFITTLGMLYAARSLVVYFTGGQPIAPLPDAFSDVARATLFGLPVLLYYAAVIVIIAHVLLETTTFGGTVRAIGGNREAASNAGINVKRISTIVYVMSGISAAFAGVLMSARLGSGQPSIGVSFELQVISAVIIGGTSLFGGIGTVWGSLLGSLVLSILTTGLILLRIDPVLQDFVIGVIIVVAVGIDQVRRRRMFRSAGVR